jgi:hypothetical protein
MSVKKKKTQKKKAPSKRKPNKQLIVEVSLPEEWLAKHRSWLFIMEDDL